MNEFIKNRPRRFEQINQGSLHSLDGSIDGFIHGAFTVNNFQNSARHMNGDLTVIILLLPPVGFFRKKSYFYIRNL